VDDIGAGYSGLTSFADLSPEIVKIDMSLVRDVHRNALKRAQAANDPSVVRALPRRRHVGGR
jgi:EAL domain-containing protein (putative c-di-GMP-specific phosphodiesterase class I)